MPTFEFAQILIEWLNSTLCVKDRPIDDKRRTSSPYDIPRNHLISSWVQYLTVVVFFGQNKRLNLVISQFASVDVNDEVFFQLAHRDIIIHMFEEIFAADTDFCVHDIG
jgi:hypothetical protein